MIVSGDILMTGGGKILTSVNGNLDLEPDSDGQVTTETAVDLRQLIHNSNGLASVGWVDFTGVGTLDTETVTINGRVYEFDTNSAITGDVAVDVSGGANATQSATAFALALANDALATVWGLRVGDTVVLTSKIAGAAITLAEATATTVISAAAMTNGEAADAKAFYATSYTVTAEDATITSDANGICIIACIAALAAPTNWIIQIRDTNGVVKAPYANTQWAWAQVDSQFWALIGTETAGIPDFVAGDVITIVVFE
jgi:hypothetical protein